MRAERNALRARISIDLRPIVQNYLNWDRINEELADSAEDGAGE